MSADAGALVSTGAIGSLDGVRAVLNVDATGRVEQSAGALAAAPARDVGRTITRMFAAAKLHNAAASLITFRFGAVQVLAFAVDPGGTLIVIMDASAHTQPVIDLVAPAQLLRSAA
ncbi:MAG: hypothetical protein V3V08_18130 [Nannocystaceae bacterium]